MTSILSVAGEALLVAISFATQFLLMLLFRSPFQHRWLKAEGSAIAAALLLSALLCVSFGLLIGGLIGAGLYFPYAFIVATAYALAVSILLWRVFRMRARLNACARGQSPFSLTHDVAGGAGTGAVGPV